MHCHFTIPLTDGTNFCWLMMLYCDGNSTVTDLIVSFFIIEREDVSSFYGRMKWSIRQSGWGNNGGVLQERRDVDYDNALIWKEIQSSLRTMWCALVFNWLVLFAFFLMYVFMINGYTYVWRDDWCMFGMKTMKSASFCMVNFCSLRNQILSSKGTFAKLSWN